MVCGGATCIPKRTIPEFQPTPVFTSAPTLDQLLEVINRTRVVQSLQSNSVSITLNNERPVNATMTWAREKRFRMTASVAGVAGLDIGSNDEAFWLTAKSFAATPEMYYARHADFDSQIDRRMLPVSPVWLVEAMGISDLNPTQLTQQPVTRGDGLVELTSLVPSPTGNYVRTLVVDPKYGFSREVYLKDPTGRLVANAKQSKHQYYPSIQTSLPHAIKVQLLPNGDPWELDITIGGYLVNGLPPQEVNLFVMPSIDGYRAQNLAQPQSYMPPKVAPPYPTTPQMTYRGVAWDGPVAR
jgi:hypothetical protein